MIRSKAAEYEHKARKNGETVGVPCLDDIHREMRSFIDGYLTGKDIDYEEREKT